MNCLPEGLREWLIGLWKIISITNGNPDYHFSAIRFSIAIFFLVLLFLVVRMRTINNWRKHQIVALIGVILMIIREATMLVFMSGWEMGIFHDPIVHFSWPPVEHFFETIALMCFCWYTTEASRWSYIMKPVRKLWVPFTVFVSGFSVYALVAWKHAFKNSYPKLIPYLSSDVDWQSHAIIAIIAIIGAVAAYNRYRGSSYLFWFWSFTVIEHVWRTITFLDHFEYSWEATIFHTIHNWTIPLMMLHFIHAYVVKMGNCLVCRRQVSIDGRLTDKDINPTAIFERE